MIVDYANDGNWWNPENFTCLEKHDFEEYYPNDFQEKVVIIRAITTKKERKEAKSALLIELLSWIETNEDDAKEKFTLSAKEVIDRLKKIERKLLS